jgi:PPP family 3-phenylpropionic acid transporter
MGTEAAHRSRIFGGLTQAGAMYFGYYMALGSLFPFINLYYERLGLSGMQIGALAALPVLASSITALVWGGLADALGAHRAILRTALALSPAAVLMLLLANSFASLVPIVAAYAVLGSAIVPLLDSAALEEAETHQRSYGSLRVWGTIGWSCSTWLVGELIEALGMRLLFYGYAAGVALTFAVSLFQKPRRQVLRSPMASGLRSLLLRRGFLVFLLSIFLLGTTIGAVNSFFSLYLDGLGAGEGVIGLAWTISALSEIPVMLASGGIMRRVGAEGLLTISFLTYALRWLLFSLITDPGWVLLPQILHGLSFGAFLVGGVNYVNERTPEGLSTTGQAVFNTVSYGLGAIAGSLLGGYLYDQVGMISLFRILSAMAATGLLVFWAFHQSAREAAPLGRGPSAPGSA